MRGERSDFEFHIFSPRRPHKLFASRRDAATWTDRARCGPCPCGLAAASLATRLLPAGLPVLSALGYAKNAPLATGVSPSLTLRVTILGGFRLLCRAAFYPIQSPRGKA